MKSIIIKIATLFVVLSGVSAFHAKAADNKPVNLTVISYNVRTMDAKDGTNSWEYRYPASGMMVDDQKPDILGFQETLFAQAEYFPQVCKGYKYVGVGSEDGKKAGEINAILYNSKTVSILKSGTFWLSEDSSRPSKGWDAASYRSATWAIVKVKANGEKVFVLNTHLDEEGSQARQKSLELIIEKIKQLNSDNSPVILLGDLSMQINDPAMDAVKDYLKDSKQTAFSTDQNGSFNNWGKQKEPMTVDYIWYKGFGSCTSYETVTKAYYERTYISDHFPVKAIFVF